MKKLGHTTETNIIWYVNYNSTKSRYETQIPKINTKNKSKVKNHVFWDRIYVGPCENGSQDRNGMDLIEAEDIKKRWQEYTEKLCKKDLHEPDNHGGVSLT